MTQYSKSTVLQPTDKLLLLLRKVDQHLSRALDTEKKIVLVVGNTGAGKSTFVNYMKGCQMNAHVDECSGEEVIVCENPVTPIDSGSESEISLTTLYTDQSTNLTYVECPGFGGNGGRETDIANIYSIAQILNHAKRLQGIVFLVSSASLMEGRDNSIRQAVDSLSAIFGETQWQQDSISSHILLLLTGASTRYTTKQLRHKFKAAMDKYTLLPESLVNAVEAYDPLDLPSARTFLHRAEIHDRILSLPGIPIRGLHDGFAFSSESLVLMNDVLEILSSRTVNMFRNNQFEDVNETLQLFHRLQVFNIAMVETKFIHLVDRLRTEVAALTAQDSAVSTLRDIAHTLPLLAEPANLAKDRLLLQQRALRRQTQAAETAHLLAQEERKHHQEVVQQLRFQEEQHALQMTQLTQQMAAVAMELAATRAKADQLANDLQLQQQLQHQLQQQQQQQQTTTSTTHCPSPPHPPTSHFQPFPPTTCFQPFPSPTTFPFTSSSSSSSVSSRVSSRSRASSAWDSFRSSVRGHGYTIAEMSQLYQAQKRLHAGY